MKLNGNASIENLLIRYPKNTPTISNITFIKVCLTIQKQEAMNPVYC